MTDQERKGEPLPPETVAALLRTALRRQKNGDRAAARALLRALSAQQPDEPRVWLALATVAETREEQRQALEQVIALDPQHPLAQRGLTRFQAPAETSAPPGRPAAERVTPVLLDSAAAMPADTDAVTADEEQPSAAPPPAEPEPIAPAPALRPVAPARPVSEIRWPLYLVLAVAIVAVLAVAFWLRSPAQSQADSAAPTPPLPGAVQPTTSGGAAVGPATPNAQATSGVEPDAGVTPFATEVPIRPTIALATDTPLPQPTIPPVLALGSVLTDAPWHASLLSPEYVVSIDGSVGSLQPRGRFMLVLITIGNDGQTPARIPRNLFALVDSRGTRYLPVQNASKVYLDTYGRGQRGDLSMEEEIPAGGGNLSVPLIFDVPLSARGLTLAFDDAPTGWAVGGEATPAITATPTP